MPGGDGTGPAGRGPIRGGGFGRGGRRGLGGGFAYGPGGKCICPNCDYKQTHQRGVPCNSKKCPKCGTLLTRALPR